MSAVRDETTPEPMTITHKDYKLALDRLNEGDHGLPFQVYVAARAALLIAERVMREGFMELEINDCVGENYQTNGGDSAAAARDLRAILTDRRPS